MKKRNVLLMATASLGLMGLTGCDNDNNSNIELSTGETVNVGGDFEFVKTNQSSISILVDKQTGRQYLVYSDSSGDAGMGGIVERNMTPLDAGEPKGLVNAEVGQPNEEKV